jgi:predicted Zn finger-like uncharacterized protein
MIEFECPECGAAMQVKDSKAGSRVRCIDCGDKLRVPLRSRKKVAAASAWPVILIAIQLLVVFALSSVVGGIVIFQLGVCPGVLAGGGTSLLCGLVWLAAITYGEFPEGSAFVGVLGMFAIIFANGFANIRQCIPQMVAIAAGFFLLLAGIGGWILIAQVDPELNQQINPKIEMKKKDPARPFP